MRRPSWAVRVTRRRMLAALTAIAATGFLISGLLRVHVETGLTAFLPAHDAAVTTLRQKERSFGADPIVVLMESTDTGLLLDASRLTKELELEGTLAKLPDVAAVYGPATALNQIAGQAQDFLAELSGRRDGLVAAAVAHARAEGQTAAQAQVAGQNAQATFDARYAPLIVQAMPAGLPTLANARFVTTVLFTDTGAVRPQWQFVVPTPKSIAILVRPRQDMDAASTARLVKSVRQLVEQKNSAADRVTVSGVPVVASSLSTEITHEVPIFGGCAVVAVGACFFLLPWAVRRRRLLPVGTTLAAVLMTLAVFGWLHHSLSLGVVAFLSVLLGLGSYYPTYFAQGAKRRVVMTVAVGSAASFATLAFSPLPFVQDIGLTMSIGVLMSALIGLALSQRLSMEPRDLPESRVVSSAAGRVPVRPRARIAAATGVVLALAAIGWGTLPHARLDTNADSFARGLSSMNDAEHVRTIMGFSGEVDLVLEGRNVANPSAIAWMRTAEDTIVRQFGDGMRPVTSLSALLRFLGASPTAEQIDAGLRLIPAYLTGAVLRPDSSMALSIFGVNVEEISALSGLQKRVLAALPPVPSGYQVHLTGLPVVAVRGQALVSSARVGANVAGILAAAIVLAFGLRRRSDAIRAGASAVLATGCGLGLLWLTNTPLNPVTVSRGPLTAAVGCEFTVLLSEARRRGGSGLRVAVVLATLSSASGYAVLMASRLPVIREFGMTLTCAVVLALGVSWCVVEALGRTAKLAQPHAGLVKETSLVGVGP